MIIIGYIVLLWQMLLSMVPCVLQIQRFYGWLKNNYENPIKVHSDDDWKKHFITLCLFIIMVVLIYFIIIIFSRSGSSSSSGSMK